MKTQNVAENNRINVYTNPEFGEMEILTIEGKEYFPAIECAKMLGYSNPRDAIARHCKTKGVVKHDVLTNGGVQEKNYISEGNLYRLITHSKLPTAERFESWVFEDVLPSIRKTGAYSMQPIQAVPDTQQQLAEAKLRNARAREANALMRAADKLPPAQSLALYRQAAELITGKAVPQPWQVLLTQDTEVRQLACELVAYLEENFSAAEIAELKTETISKFPIEKQVTAKNVLDVVYASAANHSIVH